MSHQLTKAPLGPLPVGWCSASFSDAATIAANLVPPKEWPNLPHVAPDNIQRDTGKLLTHRTISEDGVTSPKHLFEPGQLLYSKIRPYLNKCVRVDFRGLCSADMYPLDPHIDAGYLHHYILSRQFVSAVTKASGSRTVLPKTNQEQLSQIPVPVAPIPEQERISDALDSYLSRLDAAVATLEAAQKKLKAYRASVLKAAVEGRLVPTEAALARAEKRDFEPADVLLERILSERRRQWEEAELAKLKAAGKSPKDDKWKAKYEEPKPPDTKGLPELPEGWCWTTADACTDATRSITYGVVLLGDTVHDGVPTLRSSNVRHLWLQLDYVKRISPDIAAEYRRTILRGGEVLVTVRGTLGGVAVVPEGARGWNISREVAMLDLVEPALARIVASFIGSPQLQAWLNRQTKGNTYTGVNIENLKELPIPLPPLAEADRIVDEIERYLSLAAAAAGTATRQISRCARLRQAVLKWAFEGKLVDQDPNDEPAEKLLERIRADRANTPTPKRARRARGAS